MKIDYKYAVIIPATDKNQKIRNPGPIIIEVDELQYYANGSIRGMKSSKEYDLTKDKPLVNKIRSVRGYLETPKLNEDIINLRAWHGTLDIAVFESFSEAVAYKIKATNFCLREAKDKINKIKQAWDKQEKAIDGSLEGLQEKYPEMFL